MAYTRPWTVSQTGTVPANTIDTLFANLRLDLQERLIALIVNLAADPVVLTDIVLGKKTGKTMIVPGFLFQVEQDPTDADLALAMSASGYVRVLSATQPARAGIVLPNGVIITKIEWLSDCVDSGTTTFSLKSMSFGVAVPGVENSQIKAAAGLQIISSGVLSIPVDVTKYYWLEADRTGGAPFDIYACRITYNAADSRNTI